MESSGRVAVIDDEASIRRALLRVLRLNGVDAVAYPSPVEFLEGFPDNRPDCIVLDLKMPGITGLGLLRRLIQFDSPPPVIVLTAFDDRQTHAACEALGSRYFLKKPVDQRQLMDCVHRLLGETATA